MEFFIQQVIISPFAPTSYCSFFPPFAGYTIFNGEQETGLHVGQDGQLASPVFWLLCIGTFCHAVSEMVIVLFPFCFSLSSLLLVC